MRTPYFSTELGILPTCTLVR